MAEKINLGGVLPVVQTLFSPDGSLDLSSMEREFNWILDQGVGGLTTGMVSEILRLTENERQQLTEVVTSVARARGAQSVISCGSESTRTAIAHALHAEQNGATGIMAIAPTTVNLDDAAVFEYFAAIAGAVGVNVIIQDASGYVGRPLSIGVQIKLLDRFDERIYFKPEAAPIGPRLSQLRDSSNGRARVFEGSGGAALVDSFRRGIVGTMPAAEVCWAIQRIWEALCADDWGTAYRISGPLNSLANMQTSIDSYVAVEKYLLRRQKVIRSSRARGPLEFSLDRETEQELDRLLDHLIKSMTSAIDHHNLGSPEISVGPLGAL